MRRFAVVCGLAVVGLTTVAGCKKKQEGGGGTKSGTGAGTGSGSGSGAGPATTADAAPAAAVKPTELPELPAAAALPAAPMFLNAPPENPDNPTTPEKVALGYRLFFDKRLAGDGSMPCEGCHHPDKGWSSGAALDAKVGGAMNKRNAPTMLNLGYHTALYWDGRKPTIEATVEAAWQGQLGAKDKEADIAAALNAVPVYRAHFWRAFDQDADKATIVKALGSFLRALTAGDAPWDRYEKGDKAAVSADAIKGFEVFRSAGCAACHTPPLYSDMMFHQVGIGWDKPEGKRDHGRKDKTEGNEDDGKWKTPPLRNVALTAPYFHDGSVATLEAAIDVMLAGGANLGKVDNMDEKMQEVTLKPGEKQQLRAFLEALTGTPAFAGAPTPALNPYRSFNRS